MSYQNSFVLLVLLLTALSCRNKDGNRPAIEVLAPNDGQSFVANNDATIEGQASDDVGLATVTAVLSETFSGAVIGSKTEQVEGKEAAFEMEMKFGDRYTPTGSYDLRVTVYDLSGNSASETVPLELTELPRELVRMAWFGMPTGSNVASMFAFDPAGNPELNAFSFADPVDIDIDSRHRYVLATRTDGFFEGGDPKGQNLSFNQAPPQSFPNPGNARLAIHPGGYDVAYPYFPYLQSFDEQGVGLTNWEEILYPPSAVAASGDQVWLSYRKGNLVPLKVDVYDRASRNLRGTHFTGWEASELRQAGENQLIAAGNKNNAAVILLLRADNMQLEDSTASTETFIDIAGEGEDWYILLDNGMVRYDLSTGLLSGTMVGGSYQSIAWEPVSQRIYLGKENAVEVYESNGNLIATYNGTYGNINWISFQHNK